MGEHAGSGSRICTSIRIVIRRENHGIIIMFREQFFGGLHLFLMFILFAPRIEINEMMFCTENHIVKLLLDAYDEGVHGYTVNLFTFIILTFYFDFMFFVL